jgi:hypothetical protein
LSIEPKFKMKMWPITQFTRVTNNCNHPQLISLPSALLRPENNTLDIKVVGYPVAQVASRQRAGGLSALDVGLQADLAPVHGRLTALQVGIPQGVSATIPITVVPRAPRLLTRTMDGRGDALLLHSDYSLVTANSGAQQQAVRTRPTRYR